jgi:hypothetical protein
MSSLFGRRRRRRAFSLSSAGTLPCPPLPRKQGKRDARAASSSLCRLQRAGTHVEKLKLNSLSLFKNKQKTKKTQRGAAATLARDLQQKLAALQKASATLDAAWRMAVVRQPPSARDLWKR